MAARKHHAAPRSASLIQHAAMLCGTPTARRKRLSIATVAARSIQAVASSRTARRRAWTLSAATRCARSISPVAQANGTCSASPTPPRIALTLRLPAAIHARVPAPWPTTCQPAAMKSAAIRFASRLIQPAARAHGTKPAPPTRSTRATSASTTAPPLAHRL